MFNSGAIVLAGSVIVASMWPFSGVSQTDTSEYPIAAHGTLSIDNASGNIRIQGWDGSNVKVVAHRRAQSKDVLANVRFEATSSDGNLIIKSVYPNHCTNCDISFDVQLPRSAAVTAKDSSGDVAVTGIGGRLNLDTASGNIDVRQAGGPVEATAASGDINVTGAAQSLRVRTSSGSIKVDGATGSVDARASSGNVSASCANVMGVSDIRLEAASGDVKLAIPRNVGAAIAAETDSGSIRTDFGQAPHEGYAGATLAQTLGDGRVKINLTAISGSITLQAI